MLKDYLKKQTKKYNVKIARLHKMPGYSACNKEELAEKLAAYLLSEPCTTHFLSYLDEEELALLRDGAPSKDGFLCRRLVEGGYAFLEKDGSYHFPSDGKMALATVDEIRSNSPSKYDLSILLDCIDCSGLLYGATPYKNLQEMYQKATGDSIEVEQITEFLQTLPEYFCHVTLTDSMIVHRSLMANNLYEKIRLVQGANPYYYPSREDLRHLARYGFFVDEHVKKLQGYMIETLHTSPELTDRSLSLIQSTFRQGGSIKDALDQLKKLDADTPITIDQEDMKFFSLLNEVFAHTRLLLCRGYTASEKQQQIIHPKKIYPNSPCPCGSGKKYKKCCARLK